MTFQTGHRRVATAECLSGKFYSYAKFSGRVRPTGSCEKSSGNVRGISGKVRKYAREGISKDYKFVIDFSSDSLFRVSINRWNATMVSEVPQVLRQSGDPYIHDLYVLTSINCWNVTMVPAYLSSRVPQVLRQSGDITVSVICLSMAVTCHLRHRQRYFLNGGGGERELIKRKSVTSICSIGFHN